MSDRRYFVYIMTSSSLSAMYIGVTNDVGRRVFEHRSGKGSEFVKKYKVTRLVYVEEYENPTDAITREKQLKGWKRIRKNELVRAANPKWEDLIPEQSSSSPFESP
jgi:putative endonuclease